MDVPDNGELALECTEPGYAEFERVIAGRHTTELEAAGSIAAHFVSALTGRVRQNELRVRKRPVRCVEDRARQRKERLGSKSGNGNSQGQEDDDGGDANTPRDKVAVSAGVQHDTDSPFEA